jgi:tetratricopeptide (TPR) repeat protein
MVHASHAARRSGRPEEALRLAELALQNQVANAPARAAQAMAYMALGDNDGVEEALRIAETGDLDWLERARFSYTAGWFFRSLKRGTAARDAFAEAVTEAPEWAPATAAMAMTYLEADNPVQAADTLNKLLDEDLHRISRRDPVPDIPVNEINLGEIAAAMRAAFQGDERLNARLPRVEGILHAMRCLEGQRERCGTAQARLQAALNNDEADHVAHAFLGRIALISGDWGAAVNHFDRVLARQDDIAIILAMKGRALYALGRTAEAESAFKKAYNAASEMPGIYFHHAEALLAAGDRDGARQRYRTVVRLDPRDVTSRGRLLALGS